MDGLKGACCLVTGGAGFVGSTIVDQLVLAGAAEVRIMDNFVRGSHHNVSWAVKQPGVTLIDGDIRDAALVDDATVGVDYVFHQAALRITRCAEAPREAIEVLIDGTFNVLEAALRYKVRKVIAASSASVYGEPSYLVAGQPSARIIQSDGHWFIRKGEKVAATPERTTELDTFAAELANALLPVA